MLVSAVQLRDYLVYLLVRMGCPFDTAEVVGLALLEAELRGVVEHGVQCLGDQFQMIRAGRLNADAKIEVVYQSPSTATVEGDRGLGPLVATRCMRLAIEKARSAGMGCVAARNSNYFGIASHYAGMALEQDMVGLVMTHTTPIAAPPFGAQRMLGYNPIAAAFPAQRMPSVVIDFSTLPINRYSLNRLAADGQQAPEGLLQDALGQPTTDPTTLDRGGAIRMLGVDIAHGAHRGYCLTALVDLLCSVLGGAAFGPFVPPQMAYVPQKPAPNGVGMGHLFVAIRIDAFRPAEEFREAVDTWVETFRSAKGIEGSPGVVIPGDTERQRKERALKQGIELPEESIALLNELADTLGAERL